MDGWLQLFGEINEHLKEGMTATAPSKKTSILYKKMDPTVTRIKHSPANIRLDEDVFKTSWSRPIYSSWSYVFKTSLRRFQDVFKTSFPDILKTSSKRLQDALKKYLQDVFKTYHQLKLFSLTSLRNFASQTYCTNGYLQEDLPRSHFWEIYGECTKFARVIKFLKF